MHHLVSVIEELSLARNLDRVIEIVRHAARELSGADGATFVLRDGDLCHYADEDAIAPLWKGSRFPMSACISGWVMLHREPTVIEDIYADPRIPADAYRPTFVKSLAMVPIRTASPIGAIGTYWARRYRPTDEHLRLLQALADSTSCAMESVQVYRELEERVALRTAELERANQDLEAFSSSVSHDLRSPLQMIASSAELLKLRVGDAIGDRDRRYLTEIGTAVRRMDRMITGLLLRAKSGRAQLSFRSVGLDAVVADVIAGLRNECAGRTIEWIVAPLPAVHGDAGMLHQVFHNLLSNAVEFTRPRDRARIEIDSRSDEGEAVVSVRDNGVGFEPAKAATLFEGTGVGLANVRQIVERHGGRVWAKAESGNGAVFSFSLPLKAKG